MLHSLWLFWELVNGLYVVRKFNFFLPLFSTLIPNGYNRSSNTIGIQWLRQLTIADVGQVYKQKVMIQVEMNVFTRQKRTAFLKDDKTEKQVLKKNWCVAMVSTVFMLFQSRPLRYNNQRAHVRLGIILTLCHRSEKWLLWL